MVIPKYVTDITMFILSSVGFLGKLCGLKIVMPVVGLITTCRVVCSWWRSRLGHEISFHLTIELLFVCFVLNINISLLNLFVSEDLKISGVSWILGVMNSFSIFHLMFEKVVIVFKCIKLSRVTCKLLCKLILYYLKWLSVL